MKLASAFLVLLGLIGLPFYEFSSDLDVVPNLTAITGEVEQYSCKEFRLSKGAFTLFEVKPVKGEMISIRADYQQCDAPWFPRIKAGVKMTVYLNEDGEVLDATAGGRHLFSFSEYKFKKNGTIFILTVVSPGLWLLIAIARFFKAREKSVTE